MSQTDTEHGTDRGTQYSSRTMRWVSGIVSLIGLWIAASPFIWDTSEMATWNNVAVGLAIFLIAGYNFYRMNQEFVGSVGASSLVAILGLWTIVAPFAIEIQTEALGWSNVAAGALVALAAAYSAYASREAQVAPGGTRART